MIKVIKSLNVSDLYIIGWLIVYLITSKEPNPISGRLMILLVLYSFYCFIKTIRFVNKSIMLKGLYILTLFFSIYGILHILFGQTYIVQATGIVVPTNGYIKSIYCSLLTIFAFFYFSEKGLLEVRKLKIWSIVFFIVAVIQYYNIFNVIAFERNNSDTITNNAGYIVLSLFPLISLWSKNKFVQMSYSILIVIFCVLSAKRGAILISILCFSFFLYTSYKSAGNNKKIGMLVLCLVSVLVVYKFISAQLEDNYYLYDRLQQTLEGDTNGRNDITSYFIDYYLNHTGFIRQLVGGGAEYTISVGDNYAHNDWIEILINNGILGGFVYLYYWICYYKEYKYSKSNTDAYIGLGLSLVISFCMTLFSMSYNSYTIYTTIIIGYYLHSLIESKNMSIKNKNYAE